ncbi:ATP-binding protein [Pseudomonas promysalinigenes]|uniref:ATP-binding protein n=1 Tax=Pseudomonas promysalinigenes TaxID=485898 RepID=UPI0016454FAC|nr:ATP-binding protein [Pseudomonas promysalinigenes]QXI35428.1 response regulator [Pseudomonas promysalinigenes]
MKLDHLIPTARSTLATPKAARKLLHLFAFSLVASVYIGAYSYLRVTLNQEISSRRSYMNEAVFEAQGFFVSRQTLLKGLGLSTVRQPTLAAAQANNVPEEEIHIILGVEHEIWSLWLTRRMLDYLRVNHVNLLYVPQSSQDQVQRLFTAGEAAQALPTQVLKQVRSANDSPSSQEELWLTDPAQPNASLYIFIRMDERNLASGWLGLEVDSPNLIQALQHDQAGDFKLLDASGRLIVGNAALPSGGDDPEVDAATLAGFGWEGGDWLPERLTIRKHLDYSGWQIVYSVQLKSLLPAMVLPLVVALLVCLMATVFMVWLVRRIDQRLIVPAAARIDALIESEAFCSTVIRIAPVALCVLRRSDGAVVLENPLSEQWLGMDGERRRLCRQWIENAFDGEAPRSSIDELQTADGRHLYLSYAPTRYQREDVLICAFSDITEHKAAELALQQARMLADAANEAKTLFLATMSHEIRTPLYGVLATLELLSRTQLDTQQRGYLTAIEGSSATLLQLICDVLDVSKIEAGQLALELSAFSPLVLTQDLIQSYTGAAQSKGLQLFACIDPSLPDQVRGDVIRIRQILGNLLSNAVKFTETGRIVVRLQLSSREGERAMLQWQVVDTGKGIPTQDQRQLFEPFFQSSPTANVVAGTGLGLSICKRLVHLMNGTLRVFSEPGLGSSFSFTLPLEQVTPDAHQQWATALVSERIYVQSQVQELAEHTAGWLRRWGARAQLVGQDSNKLDPTAVLVELCPGLASTALRQDWSGPRIVVAQDVHGILQVDARTWSAGLNNLHALNRAVSQALGIAQHGEPAPLREPQETQLNLHLLVAEDNMVNQLILRDQLEELGCTVALASDGLEALALWQDADFDIVLTDVNMPRMNGYQLTQELRALGCSVPIIGATANAMLDEAERCLGAGMDHFLVKPFTLHALYQCLQPYQRSAS